MTPKMWFSRFKDRALSETVRIAFNLKYRSLGKMTTLRLDTENHVLELTADLVGETQPIEAKIAYRLDEQGGGLCLVPTKVECSRPWLELLAAQMLADNAVRLPIPGGLPATLAKILRV